MDRALGETPEQSVHQVNIILILFVIKCCIEGNERKEKRKDRRER